MAEDLPSALDRVIEGEEDRSGGEYITTDPVDMTENKLSSLQTSKETPNTKDTLSSASGNDLANEHQANEEKPAITKLKETGGELLTGNDKETVVSFSQSLEQETDLNDVFSSALEKAQEEVKEEKMDEEKEEEEEEDNSALKDSAQEGMVSSLQAVEEILGVGDTLSSAFAGVLAGEEQDEDENPEEIELDTGISLAVVNDDDADDDGDDHKQSCCRTCLIVLAALFVLPIVNVFSSVLSFAINGIDTGPTGTIETTSMAGPTTWNPADYCERYPEHPICLEWYRQKWGLQSTTTPSEDFCRDNPGRGGCNTQAGRKKRSRSLCDVYVWMPPCVKIKEPIDEVKTPESTEPMEAQTVSGFLNSLQTTDQYVIRHKQGSQSELVSMKESTVLRPRETSPDFSVENILKENSFPASKEKQKPILPVSFQVTSAVPSPPQPPTESVQNQLLYMFSMSSKDKIPHARADKHHLVLAPSERNEMLPRASKSRDEVDSTTCFQTASHTSSRTKIMGRFRDNMTNARGDGDKGARILLKLLCTALSNALQHDTKLNSSLWSILKLSQVAMDKTSPQQEIRDILPQIFDIKAKDDKVSAFTERQTKPRLPSVFLNKTGSNFVLVSILGEGNNHQVQNNSSNAAETLHRVHSKKVLPQGKIWTSVVTGERETTLPVPTHLKTPARTTYSWLPVRLRESGVSELSVTFGAKRTSTTRHSGVQRVKRSAPGGDMPQLAPANDPQHKAVEDTYGVIYGLFGIISGIMITVLNYRVTTVIGSCVSGLACLAASFLPPTNLPLMVFVLGVMPGIGNNLLVTSVLVALMEYFRKRPLTVLSVQDASGHLSNIAFFFVEALLFPEIGIQRTDWRGLLQYQAATYIICLAAAIVLALLSLQVRGSPGETCGQDPPEQSLRARILDISGLSMLKSPVFYALAAIFFFSSLGGRNLPKEYLDQASNQFFLLAKVLVVFMAVGAFVGSLISSCLSRKPPPVMVSVVLIAVLGWVMGVLTLTVEVVREVFDYAIAYSVLFGVFSGLRKPLMNHIIPLTLGMDHLGLAVGLTSFFSGLGSIVGKESAEAIVKDYKRVDAVFYLSGLADVVSVCPCVLLLFLLSKRTRKTAVSSRSEEDRAGPQERVNDQGTALGETENHNYAVFTVSTGDH